MKKLVGIGLMKKLVNFDRDGKTGGNTNAPLLRRAGHRRAAVGCCSRD